MKRDLSIREIAEKAGVSIATVSRVINNPDRVSRAMLDRVLPVIEQYDYVPSLAAKNIFSRRANAIAIFVYDMRNPFFLAIIKRLNTLALENNYTLLICDTENDPKREQEYYRYCRSVRVAGIVLTEGSFLDPFADIFAGKPERAGQQTMKLVSIDRPAGESIPLITSDNRQAGYRICRYILDLKHRQIAFAGCNDSQRSIDERFMGFREALLDEGIDLAENLIFHHRQPTKEAGAQAFDELFGGSGPQPTAVVCANDEIALGLIARAGEKGLRIPQDISVTGFDGVDGSFSWRPITTMKQQVDQLAEHAFDCIVKDQTCTPRIQLDMQFIPGNTTQAV